MSLVTCEVTRILNKLIEAGDRIVTKLEITFEVVVNFHSLSICKALAMFRYISTVLESSFQSQLILFAGNESGPFAAA